ncbi:MAG: HlyD family efflux transporter periplasmic adaptor subunit [Acidobacteriota bacterium]|nr:HlyD family efflux transporter periplasmic adaptor subunit [Acidobacteriota bacterium]
MFTVYPPKPADDLEFAEQRDGERIVWMAGAASVGRYLMLGATERNVFLLIDGQRTPQQICEEFGEQHGGKLGLATLTKFLTKLESYGLLAGEGQTHADTPDALQSQQAYKPIKLFNPDPLFTALVPKLRWIWTTGFFCFSLAMIVGSTLLALMNWEQLSAQATPLIRDHAMTILLAAYLIGISHEFAHGMTCKVFGGRATEVGVLIVYYFLFALYCNVSGIHLIPQRNRRLWVIAAGVYWQLMVGAVCFLLWLALAPGTLLSDAAVVFLLGSVFDVFFNANPLIKLDGYYFLSQWLRMPNLMDRSRAYWRGLLKQILFGQPNAEAERFARRERRIYLVYGLLSFLYNVAFASVLVIYIGEWLTDRFYLLGLLLSLAVVLYFVRRPIKQLADVFRWYGTRSGSDWVGLWHKRRKHPVAIALGSAPEIKGGKMADNTPTTTESKPVPFWRRRLIPLSLAVLAVAVLLLPWSASVGNYGSLMAVPGQETIIRAPENGSLVTLRVRPGDQVTAGAIIAQMGNFDVEEQITAVQSELARANAEYDRLSGEIRSSEEAVARAATQLRQRQFDYDEIENERRQIAAQRQNSNADAKVIAVSTTQTVASGYPAALAAMESEVEYHRAQFQEAAAHRDRARKLNAEGIVPRSELDAAEMRASTSASVLAATRQRLEAALIEHRRKHVGTTTAVNLASSDLSAGRLQISKLNGELNAVREVIASLKARHDLLNRKRLQFELTASRGGSVFGEELPRMLGQYFPKGAEICRVADTRQLLLRIQVPEREIGDIRAGHSVRLKARAFPDQTFRGTVTKIGGESELDASGQTVYRVELTVENNEGLLRPGMTAFARIDFDRQMIGRIVLHKIKQTLRPELWML